MIIMLIVPLVLALDIFVQPNGNSVLYFGGYATADVGGQINAGGQDALLMRVHASNGDIIGTHALWHARR